MVIDREVALLLVALRDGGAVAIANAVAERLSSMGATGEDSDIDDPEQHDDRDPGDAEDVGEVADADGEASDGGLPRLPRPVAMRQLDVADEVVLDRLGLEAALISAIPDELGRLREVQSERGDGGLFDVETVTISSDPREGLDAGSDRDGAAREREIANDRALNAVTVLEKAWLVASASTRSAIRERG